VAHTVLLDNQNQVMREMSLMNVSHAVNRQMSIVWTAILLGATSLQVCTLRWFEHFYNGQSKYKQN